MTSRRHLLGVLAVAILGALVACGGASMDFNVGWPTWPRWLSPGPVDVFGVLKESGVVKLISVQFDASAADVTVNGRPATVADLQAGQIAHVVGTVHASRVTGSASNVETESTVVGPIWSVSAQDAMFVALGQAVRTDADTVWDSRLLPDRALALDVGMRLEVHGWRNEAGEILATRIGLDDGGVEVQVVGRMANVDLAAAHSTIGGLAVDYGAASDVDVQGVSPAEGMAVVVRGTLVGGTLVAREVRSVPLQLVQMFHLLP